MDPVVPTRAPERLIPYPAPPRAFHIDVVVHHWQCVTQWPRKQVPRPGGGPVYTLRRKGIGPRDVCTMI